MAPSASAYRRYLHHITSTLFLSYHIIVLTMPPRRPRQSNLACDELMVALLALKALLDKSSQGQQRNSADSGVVDGGCPAGKCSRDAAIQDLIVCRHVLLT